MMYNEVLCAIVVVTPRQHRECKYGAVGSANPTSAGGEILSGRHPSFGHGPLSTSNLNANPDANPSPYCTSFLFSSRLLREFFRLILISGTSPCG